jgi:hypothetical protein
MKRFGILKTSDRTSKKQEINSNRKIRIQKLTVGIKYSNKSRKFNNRIICEGWTLFP